MDCLTIRKPNKHEKAYDVAKVDKRVNRAVAAANRAANAARVAAVKAVQIQMHYSGHNDNNVQCLFHSHTQILTRMRESGGENFLLKLWEAPLSTFKRRKSVVHLQKTK